MTNDPRDMPGAPGREASRRKEAMRGTLLALLERRRRRRAGLQAGAGLAVFALLAAVAWRGAAAPGGSAAPGRGASQAARPEAPGSPGREARSGLARIVRDDPSVLSRLVESRPHASSVRFVNDAELLASLAQTGTSYGLVRIAGRFDGLVINPAP